MSIWHLLHCNLCHWACPSFITSSLGVQVWGGGSSPLPPWKPLAIV
jgi:hypothetical protein